MAKIRYLVYSGGASNGYVFSGMDECLDRKMRDGRRQWSQQLVGVAANSVGGFFALARVCGFTSREFRVFVERVVADLDLTCDVTAFFRTWGILSHRHVVSVVEQLLETKFGRHDFTLADLYRETGLSMALSTYNISRERMEYLSHDTHANLPVVKAMCMTTAIPLFFPPVVYNGCSYVDGGLGENIPIMDYMPIEETLVMYLHTVHGYVAPGKMELLDYLCRLTHPTHANELRFKVDRVPKAFRHHLVGVTLPCTFSTASVTNIRQTPEHRQRLIRTGYIRMLSVLYPQLTQALAVVVDAMRKQLGGPSGQAPPLASPPDVTGTAACPAARAHNGPV